MWVVLRLTEIKVNQAPGMSIPMTAELDTGKIIGFLPVYKTREDARADFPDAPLQEFKGKVGK